MVTFSILSIATACFWWNCGKCRCTARPAATARAGIRAGVGLAEPTTSRGPR